MCIKFLLVFLEMTQRYWCFITSRGGGRHLLCSQACSNTCHIDSRWRINSAFMVHHWCNVSAPSVVYMHALIGVLINRGNHSLLSCHEAKHSTLKVITGRYIITLNSVFGQTIKVRYSSYLLYYELLVMCSWAGTNSGMDYWNGTLDWSFTVIAIK